MRRKNSRSHGTVIWRQLDRKTLQRLQLTFSLFSQNIYGSKHSIENRYFSFKSQQNQILQKSLSLTHLIQECVVSIWPSIREEGDIDMHLGSEYPPLPYPDTILIPIFILSFLVFCSTPHTFTINFQFPLLRKPGRSIGY